jgi:hypothetical protein
MSWARYDMVGSIGRCESAERERTLVGHPAGPDARPDHGGRDVPSLRDHAADVLCLPTPLVCRRPRRRRSGSSLANSARRAAKMTVCGAVTMRTRVSEVGTQATVGHVDRSVDGSVSRAPWNARGFDKCSWTALRQFHRGCCSCVRARAFASRRSQLLYRRQRSAATGNRTSKRAPVSRLHADSVPRCACTSPAAIASPRPDPLGSDESACGTRPLEPR